MNKLVVFNLDDDFDPFATYPGAQIAQAGITKMDFPSGIEPHLKIPYYPVGMKDAQDVVLTSRFRKTDDIFRLLQAKNQIEWLRNEWGYGYQISAFIPYLPFARQDRHTTAEDPNSLEVIAKILNNEGFKDVFVFDPHSRASSEAIVNLRALNNHVFIQKVIQAMDVQDLVIVAPDKGAAPKMDLLVGYLNSCFKDKDILPSYCTKERDPSTGKLSRPVSDITDYQGMRVLIVDDICDGGYTFIQLAKVLKEHNAGQIDLAVSHGIFSKGLMPFWGLVGEFHTTDSFVHNLPVGYPLHQYNIASFIAETIQQL